MKRNNLLLLFALAFFSRAIAQNAPQKFNYQAVARDASGTLMANKTIGISITLANSISTSNFTETHTVTTNSFGLFSVLIGGGTTTTGSFSSINWSAGQVSISVAIDLNATGTYTSIGSAQLLSVPYALYANQSGTGSGGGTTYVSGGGLRIQGNKILANVDAITMDTLTGGVIGLKRVPGTLIDSVPSAKIGRSGATVGQVLKWNGTSWVPSSDQTGATGSGITSLNSLSVTNQDFGVGSIGTDFTIVSAGTTHNFNIPTASATARGLLSSADWTSFNSKIGLITPTVGDMIYFDGTTWKSIGIGTSGQVLTISTIGVPTWALAGGNGTVYRGISGVTVNGTVVKANPDAITIDTTGGKLFVKKITNSLIDSVSYTKLFRGGVAIGKVLKFNGVTWAPADDQGAAGGVGISSLNGVILPSQTFRIDSAGTNFNISSGILSGEHVFNLPTIGKTGVQKGVLTITDYNKLMGAANGLSLIEGPGVNITGNKISADSSRAIWNAGQIGGFNVFIPIKPTAGYVLKFKAGQWQALPDSAAGGSGSSYLGGTGVTLNGNYINADSNVAIWNANKVNGKIVSAKTLANGFLKLNATQDSLVYSVLPSGTSQWNPNSKGIDYMAGNVGIGTASPSHALTVKGGIVVDQGNTNAAWYSHTKNGPYLTFGHDSSGEGISSVRITGNNNYLGLDLFTNFETRLSVNHNGFVGIGTTVPPVLFTVGSNAMSNKHNVKFEAYAGTGNRLLFVNSSGLVKDTASWGGGTSQWISNGSNIYFTGKVGIGPSNPTYKLQIWGGMSVDSIYAGTVVSTKFIRADDIVSTGRILGKDSAIFNSVRVLNLRGTDSSFIAVGPNGLLVRRKLPVTGASLSAKSGLAITSGVIELKPATNGGIDTTLKTIKVANIDSSHISNAKIGYSDLTAAGADVNEVLTYTATGWRPVAVPGILPYIGVSGVTVSGRYIKPNLGVAATATLDTVSNTLRVKLNSLDSTYIRNNSISLNDLSTFGIATPTGQVLTLTSVGWRPASIPLLPIGVDQQTLYYSNALSKWVNTSNLSNNGSLVTITGANANSVALKIGTGLLATANITETSDIRRKTDIQPLKSSLEKVKQLQGVSYFWKTDSLKTKRDMGVIAQEVEKVVPELVDTDAEGFKSVRYSHMVALLLEAIKEQQKQIDSLKQEATSKDNKVHNNEKRIQTLEAAVSSLNTQMQLLMEIMGSKEGVKASK